MSNLWYLSCHLFNAMMVLVQLWLLAAKLLLEIVELLSSELDLSEHFNWDSSNVLATIVIKVALNLFQILVFQALFSFLHWYINVLFDLFNLSLKIYLTVLQTINASILLLNLYFQLLNLSFEFLYLLLQLLLNILIFNRSIISMFWDLILISLIPIHVDIQIICSRELYLSFSCRALNLIHFPFLPFYINYSQFKIIILIICARGVVEFRWTWFFVALIRISSK